MQFRGMEDRLNPIAPEGVDDSTLGGYSAVHGRSPAFEGPDGCAYTVAIETDQEEEGEWVAYLVFLRWAAEGSAIMGHIETEDLTRGSTRDAARTELESIPLTRVKEVLDSAAARKREWYESESDDAVEEEDDE